MSDSVNGKAVPAKPLVIEGYQVFCNPAVDENQAGTSGKGDANQLKIQDVRSISHTAPAAVNRSDSSGSSGSNDLPPVRFQVKTEPADTGYEKAISSTTTSVAVPAVSESTSPEMAVPEPSGQGQAQAKGTWHESQVRTQLRNVIEGRKPESGGAVQNVINELLRKNEYLLAQNDAGGYKPNPRKARNPNEVLRRPELVMDNNGTTFLVSQTSQARISMGNSPSHGTSPVKDSTPGRILRPRSPTRKCSIPEKDKSHFNHALMESKVNDKSSDQIFKVQKHEMVCAVACRAMFMTQGGSLVAHFDLQFYWCNFCTYHTTNKAQLLQHTMEHRFHCKFCRYQSFSRADVIHHTAEKHSEFGQTAASLKYCTLLSDYLQIYSQDTEEDERKRAGDDHDDGPASKISKGSEKSETEMLAALYTTLDCGDGKKTDLKSLQKDYDFFDMEVENIEESDHTAVTEEPAAQAITSDRQVIASTYDVSKMITNVQTSGSAIQVLLDKSQPAQAAQTAQPVALVAKTVNQNSGYSGLTSQRSVAPSVVGQVVPNVAVKNTPNLRPMENRPPPPPPPKQRSGSGSTVSSSLYWSCGYCNFTSHSQSEIKEHSQKTHRGRPHRYVALIMPPDKRQPQNNADKAKTNSSKSSLMESVRANKDIEIDNAEEGSEITDDDSTSIASSDQDHSTRTPTAEVPTYKCYHCNYVVKKPGMLKGHMSYKHRGGSLVGLDVQSGNADKYIFFCPRDGCPFRAKSAAVYLTHVDKCTPWQKKDLNVAVETNLLNCLEHTIQFAKTLKDKIKEEI